MDRLCRLSYPHSHIIPNCLTLIYIENLPINSVIFNNHKHHSDAQPKYNELLTYLNQIQDNWRPETNIVCRSSPHDIVLSAVETFNLSSRKGSLRFNGDWFLSYRHPSLPSFLSFIYFVLLSSSLPSSLKRWIKLVAYVHLYNFRRHNFRHTRC